MDMFRLEVGVSNTEIDYSLSVSLVVVITLALFKCFGLFVVVVQSLLGFVW